MLYLIRHGQTDWNKVHKLQGSTDVPLNDDGRMMALNAKAKVDEVSIDICFTSTLQRAIETAEIILSGRDIPIYSDERIKEINFGKYEGCSDYREKPESNIYKMFHTPLEYVDEEGTESFEEVFKRAESFINEKIVPVYKEGKDILIVAHGGINLALYNLICDIPLERFWEGLMKNCEIKAVDDADMKKYISHLTDKS